MGLAVHPGLNPGQQFIKIVHEELVKIMGDKVGRVALDAAWPSARDSLTFPEAGARRRPGQTSGPLLLPVNSWLPWASRKRGCVEPGLSPI